MQISRSQIDLIIKVLLFAVGTILVLTSMIRLLKPNINNYPALDSCFETTVHKILLCPQNPNYATLDQISENLVRAIMMSEDDKFFDHKGVDWVEIKNSLKKNIQQRHFARGGSTITQQLVKNAYLHQGKSLTRKFKEYFLAQALEEKYSKSLILEKYLNLIELGIDLYGVKRGAQFYFKKPVSELELLESLYLVTLLPNPKKISKSFTDQKLSAWQIKKIKTLLRNFERRGQIDSAERVQYENDLTLFPWTDKDTMADIHSPDLEGIDFTQDQDEDSDTAITEDGDPMFPNFKATPASPDEEEIEPLDSEPKNNSSDEDYSDMNQRFGTYNPNESESSGQDSEDQEEDEEPEDRSEEELPEVYDGDDEDDMGYDAEGF